MNPVLLYAIVWWHVCAALLLFYHVTADDYDDD